ncbi:hypothetical protein OS493_013409 [Desmophyllum pertusum]|uniref:Uncharacterized protein n=1 Tax=Desmophyllum pertusum TaxID=174260 RepID=A0A9W9YDX1_9CNID|nr:hypothetical protein OS493_013409 [Desmophyllum pertusum]
MMMYLVMHSAYSLLKALSGKSNSSMATMATFPPIHPSYDLPIRPIANDIYDFQDMDLPHWTQFLREDFNDDDWLTFIHDFGGQIAPISRRQTYVLRWSSVPFRHHLHQNLSRISHRNQT